MVGIYWQLINFVNHNNCKNYLYFFKSNKLNIIYIFIHIKYTKTDEILCKFKLYTQLIYKENNIMFIFYLLFYFYFIWFRKNIVKIVKLINCQRIPRLKKTILCCSSFDVRSMTLKKIKGKLAKKSLKNDNILKLFSLIRS